MLEIKELKYHHSASTYAWICPIKAEFDYRKIKNKPFIIEGCSKYQGLLEMEDKEELLMLNISMLFEKFYIHKSIGIDIYVSSRGYMHANARLNERICTFRKNESGLYFKPFLWLDNHRLEQGIDKLCVLYEMGHFQDVGLRIAR